LAPQSQSRRVRGDKPQIGRFRRPRSPSQIPTEGGRPMPRPPNPLDPAASAAAYFGWLLRKYRGEGRAQSGLAAHLGGSATYISKLDRAVERPSRRIADALDTWFATSGEFANLLALIERERDQQQGPTAPADQAGGTIVLRSNSPE